MTSKNNNSVWAERFEALARDPALATRLAHRPDPIKGLRALPIDAACDRLDDELSLIRVSSDQDVQITRKLLGMCQAHAMRYYESVDAFNERVNAKNLGLSTEPKTRMLTSEAGLGKSELTKAILRVLGEPMELNVSLHLPPQRFVGMVLARIGGNTKRGDLLNALALSAGLSADYRSGTRAEVDHLRRQLYRVGVMLIVVDELQFASSTAIAHASIARTLHLLRQLGIPLVFVGNYSLGHKLHLRPSEERQRFLRNAIVMLPDAEDDPSFIEMLGESVRVMGAELAIDVKRDAPMVHWYTGGNRRGWRALLVLAYGEARRRGTSRGNVAVTMDDLKAAYNDDVGYGRFRRDVEACRDHLVDGTAIDSDLCCPFVLPEDQAARRAKLADQMRRAHIAYAALTDSMTPGEKAGLKSVVGTLTPLAPGIGEEAKPRRAAAPQFTLEEAMESKPAPRNKRRAA